VVNRRLLSLETKIDELVAATNRHVFKATCLKAGTSALQYGGMGGGVIAVVVLLGKLLGFW